MKNIILKTITGIAAVTACFGLSCLDSEKMLIPALMSVIPMVWIAFFVYANKKSI